MNLLTQWTESVQSATTFGLAASGTAAFALTLAYGLRRRMRPAPAVQRDQTRV